MHETRRFQRGIDVKLKTLQCPECGEKAQGTVEVITGCALFGPINQDGSLDYACDTEIWWDDQRTVTDKGEGSRVLLICPGAHQWFSDVIEW
jgi:hypothetical protein